MYRTIHKETIAEETKPCALSLLSLKQLALVDLADASGRTTNYATLRIDLPYVVKFYESSYIYTVWDFIGEFGGWVGIFLGYCVADFADILNTLVEQILGKSIIIIE